MCTPTRARNSNSAWQAAAGRQRQRQGEAAGQGQPAASSFSAATHRDGQAHEAGVVAAFDLDVEAVHVDESDDPRAARVHRGGLLPAARWWLLGSAAAARPPVAGSLTVDFHLCVGAAAQFFSQSHHDSGRGKVTNEREGRRVAPTHWPGAQQTFARGVDNVVISGARLHPHTSPCRLSSVLARQRWCRGGLLWLRG